MNKSTIIFIDLDTHKVRTEVAYTGDGREPTEQHYGFDQTGSTVSVQIPIGDFAFRLRSGSLRLLAVSFTHQSRTDSWGFLFLHFASQRQTALHDSDLHGPLATMDSTSLQGFKSTPKTVTEAREGTGRWIDNCFHRVSKYG